MTSVAESCFNQNIQPSWVSSVPQSHSCHIVILVTKKPLDSKANSDNYRASFKQNKSQCKVDPRS